MLCTWQGRTHITGVQITWSNQKEEDGMFSAAYNCESQNEWCFRQWSN